MSLFARLLFIIVAALLPPLAMQVFNEAALRDARQADVRAQALREARDVSDELARIADGVRNTLVALAEVPVVRAADGPDGPDGPDGGECAALLRAVAGRFVFLLDMQVIDAAGAPRCASAAIAARGRADDAAVRMARARDDFAVGSYPAATDGRPGLAMAYPLHGTQGGMLVADFDLGWLRAQLRSHALPPDSAITVADRDGGFLARVPARQGIGQSVAAPLRWMLTQAAPGVVEGVGRDGFRRIVGYVPPRPPHGDLFVSVGLSTDYAYAASDAAAWRGYLLVAAGLLAALLLAALLVGGTVTRPVRAILATTERWRGGDTSARVPPAETRAEFGRIAGAVNDLLDTIVANEAGLRARLAELDAVYRGSSVGLCFLDHELRFVMSNATLSEIDGMAEADVRGRTVREVMPSIADQVEPQLRRALAGERIAPMELPAAMEAGASTGRRLLVGYQPAEAPDGQVLGAVVSIQDITALRAAEQALQDTLRHTNAVLESRVAERTRQLEAEVAERAAAQAQLQQAQKMELLGQLTGGVAHDFNNLLTAIIGNLELAIDKRGDPADVERLLAAALRASDRGAALTQRMLAFGRRQNLRFEPVAVPLLLEGMADMLARTIGPPVAVQIETARGMRPARADPNQVELLVLNLAINARDAMPEGGTIRILAAQERVVAEAGHPAGLPPGNYVRITVADTGTGMDAATQARVFEPFFTTKPVGRGSGLGLSMVQGVAEQSGGGVTIESAPGHGTRVSVWLPCIEPPPGPHPAPAEPDATPTAARLLLVDDDAEVRGMIARSLRAAGYDVVSAEGGLAALALLRAGPPPDLLIVDLGLRDMAGRDLVVEARRLVPSLPVLIASGAVEAADDLGLPMLAKPFHMADLRAKVAALLRVAA